MEDFKLAILALAFFLIMITGFLLIAYVAHYFVEKKDYSICERVYTPDIAQIETCVYYKSKNKNHNGQE
jgi:hypothetical protein